MGIAVHRQNDRWKVNRKSNEQKKVHIKGRK